MSVAEFVGPFCGNDGCPCKTPGTVCEEFCEWPDRSQACARCGWNFVAHGAAATEEGNQR